MTAVWSVVAAVIILTPPAAGQSGVELRAGDPAPELVCRTLGGQALDNRALTGRVSVLVFGELYNEHTVAAAHELAEMMAGPELTPVQAQAWVIVAQHEEPDALAKAAAAAGVSLSVAHDPSRRSFANFGVRVLPTVVVIDPSGRVVSTRAGFGSGATEAIQAACLYAAGLMSAEAFAAVDRPAPGKPRAPDEDRAAALTVLGQRLLDLGKDTLAADKFDQALAVVPGYVPARVGLAQCYLAQGRLADAEQQLRDVLVESPHDVSANLGLASIALARGGDEYAVAEQILVRLMDAHPGDGEIHFMLGRVYEAQRRPADAMKSYRKAAELWRQRGREVQP